MKYLLTDAEVRAELKRLQILQKTVSMPFGTLVKDPKRSAAGKRAWETMRTPEWRRKNAARKAWVTRRKNGN